MTKKEFTNKSFVGLNSSLKQKLEHSSKEELNTEQKNDDSNTIKNDKQFKKALISREAEYRRLKKGVTDKISETLIKLEHDEDLQQNIISENLSTKEKLNTILQSIENINDENWNENNFSYNLTESIKTVENGRLELLKQQIKNDTLNTDVEISQKKNEINSLLPDLTSLTFFQLSRLGFYFFLPLILGLIITAIIISFAILISMGVI